MKYRLCHFQTFSPCWLLSKNSFHTVHANCFTMCFVSFAAAVTASNFQYITTPFTKGKKDKFIITIPVYD